MAPVLEVSGLSTVFHTRRGLVRAVQDVSFTVNAGETLAIVGESGCGKTITALSLMRLIPMPPGEITSGSVKLDGQDLLKVDEATMRQMRGSKIAMIFQEPMTALNPLLTVGKQIAEMVVLHDKASAQVARKRAVEMLHRVRIPEPERRAREYPHQMSGGMQSRAALARLLIAQSSVLLMDEPFAALDAQTRLSMQQLLKRVVKSEGLRTVLFITHDVEEALLISDHVFLMSASPGRIVRHVEVPFRGGGDYRDSVLRPEFTELKHELIDQLERLIPG
jgi:peptide/nickel transport system ATP-binding protein